jgi:hypothetical protein
MPAAERPASIGEDGGMAQVVAGGVTERGDVFCCCIHALEKHQQGRPDLQSAPPSSIHPPLPSNNNFCRCFINHSCDIVSTSMEDLWLQMCSDDFERRQVNLPNHGVTQMIL